MRRPVILRICLFLICLVGLSLVTLAGFKEDIIRFNTSQLEVKKIGGRWKIVEGSHWLMDFGTNENEARKSLEIIRHYRLNEHGFIGRPDPSMEYWLSNGRAPSGPFPGEDAIRFDPTKLRVVNVGGRWKILEGTSHSMLDFAGNEQEAWQALWTIWKYDFSYICFVGRPDPSMTYFRR